MVRKSEEIIKNRIMNDMVLLAQNYCPVKLNSSDRKKWNVYCKERAESELNSFETQVRINHITLNPAKVNWSNTFRDIYYTAQDLQNMVADIEAGRAKSVSGTDKLISWLKISELNIQAILLRLHKCYNNKSCDSSEDADCSSNCENK